MANQNDGLGILALAQSYKGNVLDKAEQQLIREIASTANTINDELNKVSIDKGTVDRLAEQMKRMVTDLKKKLPDVSFDFLEGFINVNGSSKELDKAMKMLTDKIEGFNNIKEKFNNDELFFKVDVTELDKLIEKEKQLIELEKERDKLRKNSKDRVKFDTDISGIKSEIDNNISTLKSNIEINVTGNAETEIDQVTKKLEQQQKALNKAKQELEEYRKNLKGAMRSAYTQYSSKQDTASAKEFQKTFQDFVASGGDIKDKAFKDIREAYEDTQLLFKKGFIPIGSIKKDEEYVGNLENKIKDLNKEIISLNTQKKKLEKEQKENKSESKSTSKDESKSDKDSKSDNKDKTGTGIDSEEVKKLQLQIDELRESVNKLQNEQNSDSNLFTSLKEDITNTKNALDGLQENVNNLKNSLHDSLNSELKNLVSNLQEQVNTIKNQFDNLFINKDDNKTKLDSKSSSTADGENPQVDVELNADVQGFMSRVQEIADMHPIDIKVNPIVDENTTIDINANIKNIKESDNDTSQQTQPNTTVQEEVTEELHEQETALESVEEGHEEVAQASDESATKQTKNIIDVIKRIQELRKEQQKLRDEVNNTKSPSGFEKDLYQHYIGKQNQYKDISVEELESKLTEKLTEGANTKSRVQDQSKYWTTVISLIERYKELTGKDFDISIFPKHEEFEKVESDLKGILLSVEEYQKVTSAQNDEMAIVRELSSLTVQRKEMEKLGDETDKAANEMFELCDALSEKKRLTKTDKENIFDTYSRYKESGGTESIEAFTDQKIVIDAVTKALKEQEKAAKDAEKAMEDQLNSVMKFLDKKNQEREEKQKSESEPDQKQPEQKKSEQKSEQQSSTYENEQQDLSNLENKVGEVETAINNKTEAIKSEESQMKASVDNEIADLVRLEGKLNEIKQNIKDINSEGFSVDVNLKPTLDADKFIKDAGTLLTIGVGDKIDADVNLKAENVKDSGTNSSTANASGTDNKSKSGKKDEKEYVSDGRELSQIMQETEVELQKTDKAFNEVYSAAKQANPLLDDTVKIIQQIKRDAKDTSKYFESYRVSDASGHVVDVGKNQDTLFATNVVRDDIDASKEKEKADNIAKANQLLQDQLRIRQEIKDIELELVGLDSKRNKKRINSLQSEKDKRQKEFDSNEEEQKQYNKYIDKQKKSKDLKAVDDAANIQIENKLLQEQENAYKNLTDKIQEYEKEKLRVANKNRNNRTTEDLEKEQKLLKEIKEQRDAISRRGLNSKDKDKLVDSSISDIDNKVKEIDQNKANSLVEKELKLKQEIRDIDTKIAELQVENKDGSKNEEISKLEAEQKKKQRNLKDNERLLEQYNDLYDAKKLQNDLNKIDENANTEVTKYNDIKKVNELLEQRLAIYKELKNIEYDLSGLDPEKDKRQIDSLEALQKQKNQEFSAKEDEIYPYEKYVDRRKRTKDTSAVDDETNERIKAKLLKEQTDAYTALNAKVEEYAKLKTETSILGRDDEDYIDNLKKQKEILDEIEEAQSSIARRKLSNGKEDKSIKQRLSDANTEAASNEQEHLNGFLQKELELKKKIRDIDVESEKLKISGNKNTFKSTELWKKQRELKQELAENSKSIAKYDDIYTKSMRKAQESALNKIDTDADNEIETNFANKQKEAYDKLTESVERYVKILTRVGKGEIDGNVNNDDLKEQRDLLDEISDILTDINNRNLGNSDIDEVLEKKLANAETVIEDYRRKKSSSDSKSASTDKSEKSSEVYMRNKKLLEEQEDVMKYIQTLQEKGDNRTVEENEELVDKKKEYEDIQERVNKALTDEYGITERINNLLDKMKANKEAGIEGFGLNRIDNIDDAYTEAIKVNNALDETVSKIAKLSAINEMDEFGIFSGKFSEAQNSIEVLNNELKSGFITVSKYTTEINKINNDLLDHKNSVALFDSSDVKQLKDVESIMHHIATEVFDADGKTITYNKDTKQLTAEFKNQSGQVQKLTLKINKAGDAINYSFGKQSVQEANGLSKAIDFLGDKFKNLAGYLTTFVGFYEVWDLFKQGLRYVKDFDTAMTEMRKVSDETLVSLKNFSDASFDMANEVGTTALTIQNSTADWMRLGESIDKAAESAKVSNILFNISEFEDIDSATDSLVAMSQAYQDLDKIDIVDKMNNIGKRNCRVIQ